MTTESIYSKTPLQLVKTLIDSGWTQPTIAESVGTSQSTICRILSGTHKDPRYSVVEKLRHLVLNLDEFQNQQQ